ncbi:uncharacterized protein K02A2.6-like [Ostrinia nubilalis]|uniref:uncharacterized protein K02A2.6-like n=1 Tax=Ostrinia nubilalis TaxID=29057 RepID=UPI00308249D6
MASIGKIGEFKVDGGNWTLYVERLEMYLEVNKVDKTMWRPTLIAVMGDETYELLSNLTSPEKPAQQTYEEIVKLLREHLQPKPSVMAERYRFRQRRQKDEESVAQYVSELKKLSRFCDFSASLEDNLRDQFVCGLRSDIIRQRLFAEDDLKYQGAVKLASALEAAERDAAVVEFGNKAAGMSTAAEVHAMRSFSRGRGGKAGWRAPPPAAPAHGGPSDTWRGAGWRAQPPGPAARGGPSDAACGACGGQDHRHENCRYKEFICSRCRRRGHLRRVCPERGSQGDFKRGMHHVTEFTEDSAGEDAADERLTQAEEELFQLNLNGYKPVSLSLLIDGHNIVMEVDTGSAISCISEITYHKYFKINPIEPCKTILKFYDGSKIKPLGTIKPQVKYNNVCKRLELFVIKGGTTSLLGRYWLSELNISIPPFHKYQVSNNNCIKDSNNNSLSSLLDRYKELFEEGLGRFTGCKATLRVRSGAAPVFCRPRALPYALRARVDAELDQMLAAGVIEPVDHSDWATPLVPVRKADGGLRICADYKITLNPVLLVDRFPLPRIEDLLVGLKGAKMFSKIDLSQAYNQVELDSSNELTVINTHRGLFKYNRLVYGLSSSPGIFQRIMYNLLGDIPNVEIFLDDVIIATGGGDREHLATLSKVLQRLHSHGMRLKRSKCSFMVDEVKYLGYLISKEGIKVDPEKVEAIKKIPRPRDVSELRSFLGLVNFYAKFVKNLSFILAPLYTLLKKNVPWRWNKEQEISFLHIKSILSSAEVLTHYDPEQPLYLTCDASARGIGGVLTQRSASTADGGAGGAGAGRERPVIYVSRALTDAEKNYSQIDREALAIVFCLGKLHQYLYGRRFVLRTDHKPLVSIFGPKNGIPQMAASRLQRWAIKLAAYTYDIEFVSSKDNGADGLSRLPVSLKLPNTSDCLELPEQTYLHFAQNEMLLDYNELKKQTQRDAMLGRVLSYIRDGWPSNSEIKNLQPYFNRRNEIYEELGCIMWGHRVVIPENCRSKVLLQLHESHMGIVKTKATARSYVWWPGIDEAVEALCRACPACAAEADAPPRHAPSPWPWPAAPWSRLHVDFLGPIFNKTYLVIIDAKTKWLEVFQVPSTAATSTIHKLSELFARWGLPKQLVSDNGPPFTSKEFSEFLRGCGIAHFFTAPYHPASNGAAENAVRTIKKVIKKAIRLNLDVHLFLNTFLLHYRNTEHCTTGESPAALMLGRRLRTKLDILRPNVENRVSIVQARQAESGGQPGDNRELHAGEEVWYRNYQGTTRWLPGEVSQKIGGTDYKVLDGLGRENHRHIDQLKRRSRSSLICPNSPLSDKQDENRLSIPSTTMNEAGPEETRPPSQEPAGTTSTTQPPSNEREPSAGGAASAPSPPAPEPPQSRPIRQCRLNPPKYKL